MCLCGMLLGCCLWNLLGCFMMILECSTKLHLGVLYLEASVEGLHEAPDFLKLLLGVSLEDHLGCFVKIFLRLFIRK